MEICCQHVRVKLNIIHIYTNIIMVKENDNEMIGDNDDNDDVCDDSELSCSVLLIVISRPIMIS